MSAENTDFIVAEKLLKDITTGVKSTRKFAKENNGKIYHYHGDRNTNKAAILRNIVMLRNLLQDMSDEVKDAMSWR